MYLLFCVAVISLHNGPVFGLNTTDPGECISLGTIFGFGSFGGVFEYFAHDTITQSMIYKNSVTDYYLYPWINGYSIGRNYSDASSYLLQCVSNNSTSLKVKDCVYWTSDHVNIQYGVFVDIGCNSCHFQCYASGICIDPSSICDRSNDCAFNDDEAHCVICIESHDKDKYYYFNTVEGVYEYYGFDTAVNGSVYYDGNTFYLYPMETYFNGSYFYSYFIGFDLYQTTNVFALCYIYSSNTALKYATLRVSDCTQWLVITPYGNFISNISASACSGNTNTDLPNVPSTTAITKIQNTIQNVSDVPQNGFNIAVPFWFNTNESSITFYIASYGTDDEHCGTDRNPCATLSFAALYAELTSVMVKTIDAVTFMIRGQSPHHIIAYNKYVLFNGCYPHFIILNGSNVDSLTFTFDTRYVSTLSDWFPTSKGQFYSVNNQLESDEYLCNYQHTLDRYKFPVMQHAFFSVGRAKLFGDVKDVTVTINNAIIDNWIVTNNISIPNAVAGLEDSDNLNVKYIFNNFTFKDNHINYSRKALILAAQIEIYDSQFINNTIKGAVISLNISNKLDDAKVSKLAIQNTLVDNIQLSGSSTSSFVDITQIDTQSVVDVFISGNIFNNTQIATQSLIHIYGALKSSKINIEHNSFLNINGSILNATNVQHGNFRIHDIHVSTSKMIKMRPKNENFPYLLRISHSQVNISKIWIDYFIINELLAHCWGSQYFKDQCMYFDGEFIALNNKTWTDMIYGARLDKMHFMPSITYACDPPQPFIKAESTQMHIHSVYATNDITQASLDQIKSQLFADNPSYCFIDNMNVSTSIEYYHYYGSERVAFITIIGGNVFLDNLELNAIGIAEIVFMQKDIDEDDYVQLRNIHTIYAEKYCNNTCVFDPSGLNVNIFAYHEGSGTLMIEDTLLYGAQDVILNYKSGNNYLINSTLEYGYIGVYSHLGTQTLKIIHSNFMHLGPYYTFSLPRRQMLYRLSEDNELVRAPPLISSSQDVWIENSFFHHDVVFSASWPSSHPSFALHLKVVLINNTFEPHITNERYTPKGVIVTVGDIEIYMIHNTMVDGIDSMKSLLYLNNTETCFMGNTFKSHSIMIVDSGRIQSCSRYDLQEIFEKHNVCFYGSLPRQRFVSMSINNGNDVMQFNFDLLRSDEWIAIDPFTPIIQTASNVNIILDDVTFSTEFADIMSQNVQHYIIMTINTKTFVSLDTIVFNSMYFEYNNNCEVMCYNVLHNYTNASAGEQYVSQLHIGCSNDDDNDATNRLLLHNESSTVHYTTPHYIFFEYDSNYIVGEFLYITAFITDRFQHRIDHYPFEISILFTNEAVKLHKMLWFNISDIIRIKLNATNEQKYQNITIKTIVDDDALEARNDIDLTIIPSADHWRNITNGSPQFLIILFLIILFLSLYYRHKYMQAFRVDNVLVCIIGISQFDDRKLFLSGVRSTVDKLVNLWRSIYKYDVFVCNEETLYSTRDDVLDFVDNIINTFIHTESAYNGYIFHVISHGSVDDCFITSDGNKMELDFIQHEIKSALVHLKEHQTNDSIKAVFHHCCRGDADYSDGKNSVLAQRTINESQGNYPPTKTSRSKPNVMRNDGYISIATNSNAVDEDNKTPEVEMVKQKYSSGSNESSRESVHGIQFDPELNWITIYGQVQGRTLSDSGHFTDCIHDAFANNAHKIIKIDFKSLITNIQHNLQHNTNGAELCQTNELPKRHNTVRFYVSNATNV